MNEILIDTNIMVYCFDRKLNLTNLLDDLFQSGFRVITLKKCMEELISIKRIDVNNFFMHYNINVLDFNKNQNTDDTILNFCLDRKCFLFTEDKALLEKAKINGIKTLSFAGKSLKFNK